MTRMLTTRENCLAAVALIHPNKRITGAFELELEEDIPWLMDSEACTWERQDYRHNKMH